MTPESHAPAIAEQRSTSTRSPLRSELGVEALAMPPTGLISFGSRTSSLPRPRATLIWFFRSVLEADTAARNPTTTASSPDDTIPGRRPTTTPSSTAGCWNRSGASPNKIAGDPSGCYNRGWSPAISIARIGETRSLHFSLAAVIAIRRRP